MVVFEIFDGPRYSFLYTYNICSLFYLGLALFVLFKIRFVLFGFLLFQFNVNPCCVSVRTIQILYLWLKSYIQ